MRYRMARLRRAAKRTRRRSMAWCGSKMPGACAPATGPRCGSWPRMTTISPPASPGKALHAEGFHDLGGFVLHTLSLGHGRREVTRGGSVRGITPRRLERIHARLGRGEAVLGDAP